MSSLEYIIYIMLVYNTPQCELLYVDTNTPFFRNALHFPPYSSKGLVVRNICAYLQQYWQD